MTLKAQILSTGDYRYLRLGVCDKQNTRNIYEVALERDGKPMDYQESGETSEARHYLMLKRASDFLKSYKRELDVIACDLYEELGLIGGATGSASLSDTKYLDGDGPLKLANISLSQVEAQGLKESIDNVGSAWVSTLQEKRPPGNDARG